MNWYFNKIDKDVYCDYCGKSHEPPICPSPWSAEYSKQYPKKDDLVKNLETHVTGTIMSGPYYSDPLQYKVLTPVGEQWWSELSIEIICPERASK